MSELFKNLKTNLAKDPKERIHELLDENEVLELKLSKAHALLLKCQERLDGSAISDALFDDINRALGISEK